jgi:sporulation integral membrane protein YtvI
MIYYSKREGSSMFEQKIEEWYAKTGKRIVYIIIALTACYLIVKLHIVSLAAPFIIAWILASLLNPVVTRLYKRFGLMRGLGTILSMLTILSGILWIIGLLLRQLWYQILSFAGDFSEYSKRIIDAFALLEDKFGTFLKILPASEAFYNLDYVAEQLLGGIGTSLTALIPSVYDAISKVPNLIIFIIVMLIATFFMTKDYYYIKRFIKAQLSDTIIDRVVVMQRGMLRAVGGYIKTQLILMMITFSICLIGLFLFKREYALLISIIIALVDALPVFGSGSVLIPWAIYNMIIGNYMVAIGLLGIYGIIFLMRQIMEPKILSHQIGLYALVTVMAVYIGYKTIGVLGVIVGPVIMVSIRAFQNIGVLPQFRPIKDKESKREK